MFWSSVLPFQITCVLMFVASILAAEYVQRRKLSQGKYGCLILLLAAVGFIPSCMAVDAALAPFRFGTFNYATSNELKDERIRYSFPDNAREITVFKRRNGYAARFQIDQADLDSWYEEFISTSTSEYSSDYPGQPPKPAALEDVSEDGMLQPIRKEVTGEWIHYNGPHAADGGGFEIWYNPASKWAIEDNASW